MDGCLTLFQFNHIYIRFMEVVFFFFINISFAAFLFISAPKPMFNFFESKKYSWGIKNSLVLVVK